MYNKREYYEDPFGPRVFRSMDSGYASSFADPRNQVQVESYRSSNLDSPTLNPSGTHRTITVTKIPAPSQGFLRESESINSHRYNNGPSYADEGRPDNTGSYRSMVVTQVGNRGGQEHVQLGGRNNLDLNQSVNRAGYEYNQGQSSAYGAKEHEAPFPPYAPGRSLPPGASSRLVYSLQPTNQTIVRSKPFNPAVSGSPGQSPQEEVSPRSFRAAGLQDPRPYQLKPTMDPRDTFVGLKSGISYDSPVSQPHHHIAGKEAEVDALTDLLMQNMQMAGDPNFFGMCARCGRSIMGENTGCTALDQLFHIECFRCISCTICLRGHPFYAMEGKPYCENCYMSTLEKCSVCSKPITDRMLRATGKPYHPSCFTCVVCGINLDGVSFTVDASSQTYCIEDFHRKFAPRCCACLQPIMPLPGKDEAIRIVALDRSFHVGCYKCEGCNMQLSSEAEGRGCYPLDDHILCKNCNAKHIQAMTSKPTTDL